MTRDQAAEEIRARGGSIGSAISKNTDYLVAGENTGTKIEKAKELNVPIMSEQQFLQRLGGKRENAERTTPAPQEGRLL
jgi:DNA ligase (NAD+)